MESRKISQTTVDFNFSDSRDLKHSNSDRSKRTIFENFLSTDTQSNSQTIYNGCQSQIISKINQEEPLLLRNMTVKSVNNGIKPSPVKHGYSPFKQILKNQNSSKKTKILKKKNQIENDSSKENDQQLANSSNRENLRIVSATSSPKETDQNVIQAKLDNTYKRSFSLISISNTGEKKSQKTIFETSKSSIKHINTSNSGYDDAELLSSLGYDNNTIFHTKHQENNINQCRKQENRNYESESDFQSCKKLKYFNSKQNYEGSTQIYSVNEELKEVRYGSNAERRKEDSKGMIEFYQYRSKKDLFGTQSRSRYLDTEDCVEGASEVKIQNWETFRKISKRDNCPVDESYEENDDIFRHQSVKENRFGEEGNRKLRVIEKLIYQNTEFIQDNVKKSKIYFFFLE